MKIAVLADIHANLAALHAVVADIDAWAPDTVIVAGDIVSRGPQSGECLELVLRLRDERGWQVIQGNHEEYLIKYARERAHPAYARGGPRHEISRIIAWTYTQVVGLVPAVAKLPERLDLDTEGGTLTVLHASLRHNRDGVLRQASDAELRHQIDTNAAVFCVGHTHMPFVRWLDSTLVVNVGSVGLPFDGDTRAGYARLSHGRAGWSATIVRLAYDLAATEREFIQHGTLAALGPIGTIMLRELQQARSLMYDFAPLYLARINAGEIGVDEAVHEFLGDRAAPTEDRQ